MRMWLGHYRHRLVYFTISQHNTMCHRVNFRPKQSTQRWPLTMLTTTWNSRINSSAALMDWIAAMFFGKIPYWRKPRPQLVFTFSLARKRSYKRYSNRFIYDHDWTMIETFCAKKLECRVLLKYFYQILIGSIFSFFFTVYDTNEGGTIVLQREIYGHLHISGHTHSSGNVSISLGLRYPVENQQL